MCYPNFTFFEPCPIYSNKAFPFSPLEERLEGFSPLSLRKRVRGRGNLSY
jgi:hypothetical protein